MLNNFKKLIIFSFIALSAILPSHAMAMGNYSEEEMESTEETRGLPFSLEDTEAHIEAIEKLQKIFNTYTENAASMETMETYVRSVGVLDASVKQLTDIVNKQILALSRKKNLSDLEKLEIEKLEALIIRLNRILRSVILPKYTMTKTNYNLKDVEKARELMQAVRDNDLGKVEELLNAGVDINAHNTEGFTALMYANYEIAKLLIDWGANVDAPDKTGRTALMLAISNFDEEIVNLLLESGANINKQDNDGYTALMYAIVNDNEEIVKLLINSGAYLSLENKEDQTALVYAIDEGNSEIADLIKSKIGEINKRILALSCKKNLSKLEKLEIEKLVAQIGKTSLKDIQDEYGNNPLHLAILNKNFELAKWLIKENPDLLILMNKSGQTPLESGLGEFTEEFWEFLDQIT